MLRIKAFQTFFNNLEAGIKLLPLQDILLSKQNL